MSNTTTLAPPTANSLSLFALPNPVDITLQGVIVERDKLIVFLTDGRQNYTLEPKARVLVEFPRFQRYVVDQLNLMISHRSQDARNRRCRRREWSDSLRTAFDRGMGK